MREEAVKEIERRFNLLLENAKPNTVAYGTTGSKLRFYMALNLLGGSMADKASLELNPKSEITWDWTDEKYNEQVLTKEEYNSDEYDSLLTSLFSTLNRTVNKKKVSKSKHK